MDGTLHDHFDELRHLGKGIVEPNIQHQPQPFKPNGVATASEDRARKP